MGNVGAEMQVKGGERCEILGSVGVGMHLQGCGVSDRLDIDTGERRAGVWAHGQPGCGTAHVAPAHLGLSTSQYCLHFPT